MYLTDQDARPAAGGEFAHLWDNGKNAIDELETSWVMSGRAVTFRREYSRRRPNGDMKGPLYMYHRYQVEAQQRCWEPGIHVSLKGTGDRNPQIVHEEQRRVGAVAATLKPRRARLPESRRARYRPVRRAIRAREKISASTSPSFDALAPAEAVADHVLVFYSPERAARLSI
jgi:hypothetical protein